LLALSALVVVGLGVAYSQRMHLVMWAMQPRGSFAAQTPPPAPDYARPESWAARPERVDPVDTAPPGLTDEQASAPADVFFIHPTTYFSGKAWNAAYDAGGTTGAVLETGVLRNQASVFTGCCRVYAPHYRQAALYSFRDDNADSLGALDLAYQDVVRAFEHFVKVDSPNRPFILAAHSQGSLHAVRLWQEHIAGTPLQARMVVAYIVGYMIPTELVKDGLPVCEAPTQTGCVAGWRTYQSGVAVGHQAPRVWLHGAYVPTAEHQSVCTNPLTFSAAPAQAAENLGSLAMRRRSGATLPALVPGIVGARCQDGYLLIDEPTDPAFHTSWMGKGNYHVLDYGLFYLNLRNNAVARVRAFVAGQVSGKKEGSPR
jgi:hypothetical protein